MLPGKTAEPVCAASSGSARSTNGERLPNEPVPEPYQSKIVSAKQLALVAARARAGRKTIVQCHGCFDIVHPGHIRYLEFARRQGDLLVVTITGDAEVGKGDDRPFIPQELRAENLAALTLVDYVCISPDPTAVGVLELIRPDVYVKGREYERSTDPRFIAEREVVERYGGRVIFSSGEIVFSSSSLIRRMPRTNEHERQRLGALVARHDIARSALGETLKNLRGLRVLVVGDIIIDRYIDCDALDVASESPMLSLVQRDERQFIGGAAIVARHVAALGGKPFLLSAAADDDATRRVTDLLERESVEAHLPAVRPALVEKTRFLAEDNKLLKVERAERLPLDSITERESAELLAAKAKSADAAIFCDFGYGTVTGALIQRVLPTLRQNVRIIAADVSGGRTSLLDFRNVDLLCPTEREARATLNDHDSGVSSIAWDLLDRTQARHVFVTLGKRGLIAFDRQSHDRAASEWSGRLRSEQLPALTDRALDQLGCGDALLAASTCALACGASVMQSAYLGSAAAAIEAEMPGNEPVSADAISAWLDTRGELIDHRSQPVEEVAPQWSRGDAGTQRSASQTAHGG